MFDDYDYKDTSSRITVKFSQVRDEPMYPWEIAGFLNKLNTVYYKFELLNSISSALLFGIKAEDIFVFDHSLPLYERYSELDLLSEPHAARLFYQVGLPIPMAPSKWVYEYNCLYRYFDSVNSFLRKNHVQPLRISHIGAAYEELQAFGLEIAEGSIFSSAVSQAARSYEAAAKRGEKKQQFSPDDLTRSLEKYRKYKAQLFLDLEKFQLFGDKDLFDLATLAGRENKRLSNFSVAFFECFEKITRPLVCVRLGKKNIRVLGRSLVNKREQTGLELKEVKRNSPLGAIFEGGVALYQAIQQERRAKELHDYDLKIKRNQLALVEEQLREQKVKNLSLELDVAEKLDRIAKETDIFSVRSLPPSFIRDQLMKEYGVQYSNAGSVLHGKGLYLEGESVSVDVKI